MEVDMRGYVHRYRSTWAGMAVSGFAFPGEALTSPMGDFWYRDGVLIPGAFGQSYVVGPRDIGCEIRCGLSKPVTIWHPRDVPGVLEALVAFDEVYHDDGVTLATNGQTVRRWRGVIQQSNNYSADQGSGALQPLWMADAFGPGLPGVQISNTQGMAMTGMGMDSSSYRYLYLGVRRDNSPGGGDAYWWGTQGSRPFLLTGRYGNWQVLSTFGGSNHSWSVGAGIKSPGVLSVLSTYGVGLTLQADNDPEAVTVGSSHLWFNSWWGFGSSTGNGYQAMTVAAMIRVSSPTAISPVDHNRLRQFAGLCVGKNLGLNVGNRFFGTPFPGETLTSIFAGQWYLDKEPIAGEVGTTYTIKLQDIGKVVTQNPVVEPMPIWHPRDVEGVSSVRVPWDNVFNAVGPNAPATDGQTVREWRDILNHYPAEQATGTAQPVYRANGFGPGLPALEFDGADDHLNYTAVDEKGILGGPTTNSRLIIAAFKHAAPKQGAIFGTSAAADNNPRYEIALDSASDMYVFRRSDGHGGSERLVWLGAAEANAAHVATNYLDFDYIRGYLDGVYIGSNGPGNNGNTNSPRDVRIGRGQYAGYYRGMIGCVMLASRSTSYSPLDLNRLHQFAGLCMGKDLHLDISNSYELSGTPFPGQALTSRTPGRWFIDDVEVHTGPTYTVKVTDIGKKIRCERYSNIIKVWHPKDVAGVKSVRLAWEHVYNAVGPDVPATDGQTVHEWRDTVNGYAGEQTTGTKQPLFREDVFGSGLHGLEFDGTDDELTLGTNEKDIFNGPTNVLGIVGYQSSKSPNGSMFVVTKSNNASQTRFALGTRSPSSVVLYLRAQDFSGGNLLTAGSLDTAARVLSGEMNAAPRQARAYLDGVLGGSATLDNNLVMAASSPINGLIGREYEVGQWFGGVIGVLILLSRTGNVPVSTTDFNRLHQFAGLCVGKNLGLSVL